MWVLCAKHRFGPIDQQYTRLATFGTKTDGERYIDDNRLPQKSYINKSIGPRTKIPIVFKQYSLLYDYWTAKIVWEDDDLPHNPK